MKKVSMADQGLFKLSKMKQLEHFAGLDSFWAEAIWTLWSSSSDRQQATRLLQDGQRRDQGGQGARVHPEEEAQ